MHILLQYNIFSYDICHAISCHAFSCPAISCPAFSANPPKGLEECGETEWFCCAATAC